MNTVQEILLSNLKLAKIRYPDATYEEQLEYAKDWTTDDLFYELHDLIFEMRIKHLQKIVEKQNT